MKLGRYELVEKLSSGGMAEVYLARTEGPLGFQKKVVVKRILPHLTGNAAVSAMFLAEAKLTALLDHPHLVHTFDFGEADGTYFIAMEYIQGLTLRQLSKRAHQAGLPLPPVLCARIIAQVCEGLAYAHEFVDPATGKPLGLIHRDISPDNIIVSSSGAVKLVDFGIAKAANQEIRTETGIVKGKVAYLSPEQVLGQPLDARADLFSLGTLFYELLAGRKPFEAECAMGTMNAILSKPPTPMTAHRSDVPVALQRILERALAKKREERYPNCRELHRDVERYLQTRGEPVGHFHIAQLVTRLSSVEPNRPSPPREQPAPVREHPAAAREHQAAAREHSAPVREHPAAAREHSAPARSSPPSRTQIAALPWATQPPQPPQEVDAVTTKRLRPAAPAPVTPPGPHRPTPRR